MTILGQIATWIGLGVGVPPLALGGGTASTCIGCGKRGGPERPMVAGPQHGICEPCAAEGLTLAGRTGPGAAYPDNDILSGCDFCGTERAAASGLVGWPRGAICKNCLELSQEIFQQSPK